ncbi:kinase-associated lipoprotein B [Brevibacillus thermoruber]|uniref:Kinase-associated lipoprotein B n=1 Tax=Brevibacillus thermoruber TaxID=33942 RepID=A0A9X3TMP4_9BACL|nr:kinase-associated lipoprotein B [Brevibacillus thermoruber]MDA5107139.1 kinase-associated lipoprotein B [Brevibacillus thermoruber]
MSIWKTGDLVRVSYKTGEYVTEVLEDHGDKLLVKVLAVLKYPTQGDLHNPYEVDVPLFHQRPALSYQEKIMVPSQTVIRYGGAVPDYKESVQTALEREMDKLRKMVTWAQRCLDELGALRKETFTNNG